MMQRTKQRRESIRPRPIQEESHEQAQNAQAVTDRAAKANRARLGKVTMRHGDFFDARAEPDRLRDDFLVEDEIVRVQEERRGFQETAAESAEAGVIFGKVKTEDLVLAPGKEAIRDPFVERHPAGDRVGHAGAEDDIGPALDDRAERGPGFSRSRIGNRGGA